MSYTRSSSTDSDTVSTSDLLSLIQDSGSGTNYSDGRPQERVISRRSAAARSGKGVSLSNSTNQRMLNALSYSEPISKNTTTNNNNRQTLQPSYNRRNTGHTFSTASSSARSSGMNSSRRRRVNNNDSVISSDIFSARLTPKSQSYNRIRHRISNDHDSDASSNSSSAGNIDLGSEDDEDGEGKINILVCVL